MSMAWASDRTPARRTTFGRQPRGDGEELVTAVVEDPLGCFAHVFARERERELFGIGEPADADEVAGVVEERTSGLSAGDRGVGLDVALVPLLGFPEARHDARRDRGLVFVARRLAGEAHEEHLVASFEPRTVGDVEGRDARFDRSEQRDVRRDVGAHERNVVLGCVCAELHVGGVVRVDDVLVGEHVALAVERDRDAGARAELGRHVGDGRFAAAQHGSRRVARRLGFAGRVAARTIFRTGAGARCVLRAVRARRRRHCTHRPRSLRPARPLRPSPLRPWDVPA